MPHPVIDFLRQAPRAGHPGWNQGEFSGWRDEQMSWKTTCYVGDWSFLWDIRVDGPGALELFRDSGVNSMANFSVGQGKHLVQCSERGKVLGEGVLLRIGPESFTTQSTTALWSAYLASRGGYDMQVTHLDTFQFQVQGPTALAVCEKAARESLSDIRFMRFREVVIGGATVKALRQGMAGEVGFELHGDAADAPRVLDALLDAGQEHGIRRLGRRTVMINHLEAAFPTGSWHYQADFFADPDFQGWLGENFDMKGLSAALGGSFVSDDLEDYLFSPYELGWGKQVRFDHEFTGRTVLEREAAAGPKRVRTTLEWNPDDVVDVYRTLFSEGPAYDPIDLPHSPQFVFWADEVRDRSGRRVGLSTQPGYSYFFRKMLSLAYLEPGTAAPGTEVTVLWGEPGSPQTEIRAVVAPAPYKTDRRRIELTQMDTSAPVTPAKA